MSLWGPRKPITAEQRARFDEMAKAVEAISPEDVEERLVTHCEHGTPRMKRCCWCYVQTAKYRQSVADAMWHVVD